MTRLLDSEEIDRQLADLAFWSREDGAITRTYEAADFMSAIRIVDDVARDAQEMDHHPDIDIRWRTLIFVCSTHSAGGVTQFDIELAHRIDDVINTAHSAQGLA